MSDIKRFLKAGALGAVVAAGALAASAGSASAYVACNRFGECWHVHQRVVYPGGPGVVVYPEGWRPGPGYYRHYRWLPDRFDRGYYWHSHWRRY